MKKKLRLGLFVGAIAFMLSGCCFQHEWLEATCSTPKTCEECGKTEGDVLDHKWQEATCSAPKTCKICGETEGETLDHEWQEATCSTPKTCEICEETEGEGLNHEWQEATCSAPKTCALCGATEGESLGHKWEKATCTVPKTCAVCKKTEGAANGEHDLDLNGKCKVCKKQIGVQLTMENYAKYLQVNSSFEKDSKGRAKKSYTIVNNKKDAKFYNVKVTIGYHSDFETEKWHPVLGIQKFSSTNHSVSYTVSLNQRGFGNAYEECEFSQPNGFDHTYNVIKQECKFDTYDGVTAVSGFIVE